ncbi:MAG TPA: hypothetical protein PLP19_04550 [bacterium]|nr:hypothetical protein [bacterium]HPN42740.1 hypothetical protein [bacterium]
MVINPHILEEFERQQQRREKVDFNKNRRLFKEMYKHAVRMGAIPSANPLEGIEVKIKLARIINSV